jgi:hypothetical protein
MRGYSSSRGAAPLVYAAVAASVAAVATTAARGLVQPVVAFAFFWFIAFGELLRVTLPGDREVAPIGSAAAMSYALLADLRTVPSQHGVAQTLTVTSCAMLVGALPHLAVGRPPQLENLARRMLGTMLAAAAFRPLYTAGELRLLIERPFALAVALILLVTVLGLVDALLATLARTGRGGVRFVPALRDELRFTAGIGSAVGASGLLLALAARTMGLWAIPVFSVPLLLTQFAFRRFAAIRATYLQTIRSLARVTEVGGYTETGHARRVAQLSVAVGRELGMAEPDLLDLEYAALMHDIGQLSLTDPIPGGATVVVAPYEQRRIAELGAEIIRQTGVLGTVATIVERQVEPYRRPGSSDDADVPLASRVIRAVNAYDDLVGGSLESTPRLSALERLRLGMTYEYDPRVVEALGRVLERSAVRPA